MLIVSLKFQFLPLCCIKKTQVVKIGVQDGEKNEIGNDLNKRRPISLNNHPKPTDIEQIFDSSWKNYGH